MKAVDMIKLNIPKAYFYSTETDSDYPKGCYLYVADDDAYVFFNQHVTGSKDSNSRHICRNGK